MKNKWQKHLMMVYKKEKKKNSKITLRECMKKAKRSYKK